MRIISSFYDYYDKGVAYGIDPNLIYVRDTKVLLIEKKDFAHKSNELFQFVCWAKPFEAIAFCGKMYPVYRNFSYLASSLGKTHKLIDKSEDCYYSTTCRSSYSFREVEEDYNYYLNNKASWQDTTSEIAGMIEKAKTNSWRKGYREVDNYIGKQISDDLFREYNAPIFAMKCEGDVIKVTINPVLNNYNFITQVDPVTAFQDISMYIGNNLVRQVDPTVNFSDELKRDIAGFDNWSFRKHKKDPK